MKLSLFLVVPLLALADTNCPRYPEAQLTQDLARIELERAAMKHSGRRSAARNVTSNNFIDDYIFDKMARAGIGAAPAATDLEFLRRVYLDVTGRIPPASMVEQVAGGSGNRAELIQSLIGSEAFVDYWTQYLAARFEVTSGYYNEIPIAARNLFHWWLRDSVRQDKPYNELVSELLTGQGRSDRIAPLNFVVRGWQSGDPIQDTWDTLTDRATTKFLGLKTECISCHDGRRHLEQINLYMTKRRRAEFWRMSAFFSRMNLQRFGADVFNQGMVYEISDRPTGGYHTSVSPTNPGPRPARAGGSYDAQYMFTGEAPSSPNWRSEFARILTSDRQFARATVNYVWAHFFRRGIVDPPDAWDLDRVDPNNPPPSSWPMQSSHPELLEALTDQFIRSGYRLRPLIRLIVESNAYQLSSRYEGQWQSHFALYFAKQTPRRLSAEEMYDAVITSTATERPIYIQGFPEPVWYASQLPDPTEPRQEFSIRNFLTQFGRGDWWTIPSTKSPSLLQVLYLMNDYMNVSRSHVTGGQGSNTRVAKLAQSSLTEEEAVRQLFMATLSRYPTSEEQASMARLRKGSRENWLSDVQWALLNKLDFIFNY